MFLRPIYPYPDPSIIPVNRRDKLRPRWTYGRADRSGPQFIFFSGPGRVCPFNYGSFLSCPRQLLRPPGKIRKLLKVTLTRANEIPKKIKGKVLIYFLEKQSQMTLQNAIIRNETGSEKVLSAQESAKWIVGATEVRAYS